MIENGFRNSIKDGFTQNIRGEERFDSFQLDFVYFHQLFGIFHIEVKYVSSKGGLLTETKKARKQLNRQIPKRLLTSFCAALNVDNVEGRWQTHFAGAIVYVAIGLSNFPFDNLM